MNVNQLLFKFVDYFIDGIDGLRLPIELHSSKRTQVGIKY